MGNKEPDYDEVPVFISVPGLGSIEIPAVIYKEIVYLAIANVFDFLKIRNNLSSGLDSVSGYFINPQASFLIEKKQNRIVYGKNIFDLKNTDLIQTETNLYLRSDYFGQVFGLKCTFNFRSLSVILNTKLELPIIREMRLDAMRNNIRQLKGELRADTNISGRNPLFHFGMADWSLVSTQNMNGLIDTRLNLAIGTILAGGEANVSLNYDRYSKFSGKHQYYLWRLVNNNRPALRQVMAGKIFTQATSSIYCPVVGVQFTNTPTTYRRSFGSYLLSDRTEPNWIVELYVNNVLVNYVKADASGFFSFEVPLVYGNSIVKLRYYGPWGEDRTTQQNINIPFNFIPYHQFEYTLSAGMIEDSLNSRFSRVNFNYGLSRRLTIGGGVEYLSSVTTGERMPFIKASLRLASNLLFSSEYVYGVRMKDVLSYRLPSNLQFEFTYSKYKKEQKAINNSYLEERRAVVSYPFHKQKISVFSRLTLNQIILASSKYTTVESLLSGVAFGVNANLTTYALINTTAQPYVYSNFSSTFRVPGKFLFTPQIQYEHSRNKVIGLKGEIGKPLFNHGYGNIYYERNFKSLFQSIGVGFRYDFSFAQISFFARHGDHTNTLTQSARGSLIYNSETNYLGLNNHISVGKSGMAIAPYLDLNCNGKRDKNEPKAFGLKVQLNAGRVTYNTRDTSIIITDIEPYTSYIVRLKTDGFENITWQIKNKTLNVAVSANQLQLVEIPVSVVSEVSGTIFMDDAQKGRIGLERIIVSFYNSESKLVGKTLSAEDGLFTYIGLLPGFYTARLDKTQLEKLNLSSAPQEIPFNISISTDGEEIEGLEFILHTR